MRDALLAKARAPRDVNPVDWVAERAWLLLRMGEADAARMLVAGVDTDRFTPKMVQVAVQSALANADPPALCPIENGIRKYDSRVRAVGPGDVLVACGRARDARRRKSTTRAASAESAGSTWRLRRKWSGAAPIPGRRRRSNGVRSISLTAWRFGLAAATGMIAPDRLMNSASPQLRAFQARAPLLSPQQRLDSAFVAAGLGVFSSQTMVDLYSAIYDSTDPERPCQHRCVAAAPGLRRQGSGARA